MAAHKIKPKAYKLDLIDLHALCEANYRRLMRLFPDYEVSNRREFKAGDAGVQIEVVERCRYTTMFTLRQHSSNEGWLGDLHLEVRAYHDAAMLEVSVFKSHGRIAARYGYPNSKMYQQDEKAQQNRFLAEWLEFCLINGIAAVAPTLSASER